MPVPSPDLTPGEILPGEKLDSQGSSYARGSALVGEEDSIQTISVAAEVILVHHGI